jgi:hypothetical protein
MEGIRKWFGGPGKCFQATVEGGVQTSHPGGLLRSVKKPTFWRPVEIERARRLPGGDAVRLPRPPRAFSSISPFLL